MYLATLLTVVITLSFEQVHAQSCSSSGETEDACGVCGGDNSSCCTDVCYEECINCWESMITDQNWGDVGFGSALLGGDSDRCLLRYATLGEAQVACEARPSDCKGITKDNGQCGKKYELRGNMGELSGWVGMNSWTNLCFSPSTSTHCKTPKSSTTAPDACPRGCTDKCYSEYDNAAVIDDGSCLNYDATLCPGPCDGDFTEDGDIDVIDAVELVNVILKQVS